jgi:hypothetical protein
VSVNLFGDSVGQRVNELALILLGLEEAALVVNARPPMLAPAEPDDGLGE